MGPGLAFTGFVMVLGIFMVGSYTIVKTLVGESKQEVTE